MTNLFDDEQTTRIKVVISFLLDAVYQDLELREDTDFEQELWKRRDLKRYNEFLSFFLKRFLFLEMKCFNFGLMGKSREEIEKKYGVEMDDWERLEDEDKELVWTKLKLTRKEFRISIVVSSSDEFLERLTRKKYGFLKLKELYETGQI